MILTGMLSLVDCWKCCSLSLISYYFLTAYKSSINIFRFYLIKGIGIYCVINNAYNKLGLGECSQSPTHRTRSCVPRWGIEAHNDRHLSWHWYFWSVVFLIFYRHVIRWNIIFLMLISKYILLDHGYEFDTQNHFINCKTWRNNCLIFVFNRYWWTIRSLMFLYLPLYHYNSINQL